MSESMNIVEDIENIIEKEKIHTGKLFPIHSYERLEKKASFKNLGRNDKCFCGSEKKLKKCCLHSIDFSNIYEIKENKRSAKNMNYSAMQLQAPEISNDQYQVEFKEKQELHTKELDNNGKKNNI